MTRKKRKITRSAVYDSTETERENHSPEYMKALKLKWAGVRFLPNFTPEILEEMKEEFLWHIEPFCGTVHFCHRDVFESRKHAYPYKNTTDDVKYYLFEVKR